MPAEDQENNTWPPPPSAPTPFLPRHQKFPPWLQAILACLAGGILGGVLLPLLVLGLTFAVTRDDDYLRLGIFVEAAFCIGAVLGAMGGLGLWRICGTRKG